MPKEVDIWTPRAVIDRYPNVVQADRIFSGGFSIAIFLTLASSLIIAIAGIGLSQNYIELIKFYHSLFNIYFNHSSKDLEEFFQSVMFVMLLPLVGGCCFYLELRFFVYRNNYLPKKSVNAC